jgi:spermidine synthase
VLLIGGGVAGAAREIRRASPDTTVTYVELDPALLAAGRRLLPHNLDDPGIRIVTDDGRRFVRRTVIRFDLVIVDLPDPSTSQLNRFYTEEFIREVRRVLAPGGVLSFGLGRYENYVSPELARLLASAHRTLTQVFPEVLMIPGGRVFFLSSDQSLDLDIAGRLERRGIHAQLVNRHYLDATLAPDRLADLDRAVARPAAINTDFNPALYYYHLRHWLSQFTVRTGLLGGILLVLLAAYLLRLRAVPRLLFASGFAASGLEIVLLLGYQILYGSVYRQVGLVVTVFMAGLAVGAWWAGRRMAGVQMAQARPALRRPEARPKADSAPPTVALPPPSPSTIALRLLPRLALGIAVLGAALPWLLRLPDRLGSGPGVAGQVLILLLTLGLAVLVGAQFPLAGAADSGESAAAAARLFSADLVGAALGALLVSALLIPLIGVTAVCLLTAGLNAGAAALAWRAPTA